MQLKKMNFNFHKLNFVWFSIENKYSNRNDNSKYFFKQSLKNTNLFWIPLI